MRTFAVLCLVVAVCLAKKAGQGKPGHKNSSGYKAKAEAYPAKNGWKSAPRGVETMETVEEMAKLSKPTKTHVKTKYAKATKAIQVQEPAQETTQEETEAEAVDVVEEEPIPAAIAAEIASLRAELAATAELERLRAQVERRAAKVARQQTPRPPKAKKCLDIDFAGTPEEVSETGEATRPPVVLQRCSCSCRPHNETTTTDATLVQEIVNAVESAEDQASLDQI